MECVEDVDITKGLVFLMEAKCNLSLKKAFPNRRKKLNKPGGKNYGILLPGQLLESERDSKSKRFKDRS